MLHSSAKRANCICLLTGDGKAFGHGHFARVFAFLLAVSLQLSASGFTLGAGHSPRILVIYQDNPTLPSVVEISSGLYQTLNNRLDRPEIYPEYLDATRFPGPERLAALAETIARKYADIPPDVVVAIGPEALQFVLKNRERIAPNKPLVFGDVSQRSVDRLTPPADANGVVTPYDIASTARLAMLLQPDARRIIVMSGSSDFDRYWQQNARNALGDRFQSLPVEYVSGLTVDGFAAHAASLPRRTILLMLTVLEDGAGTRPRPRDVTEEVAAMSNAPTYGLLSSYIGTGIVGGYMATYLSIGEDVGELTVSVLTEEKRGVLLHASDRPVVDWRALSKWDIGRNRLPKDVNLLFYSPTPWEEHRTLILLVAAGVGIQTLAILGLLHQRRRRRSAEIESRIRLLEVVHLNQSATAGALSASIAHELNQPLGAIRSNAEAAEILLRAEVPNLTLIQQILADIRDDDQRAGDIVVRLRALLTKRREIEWQDFDLWEAVHGACRLLRPEAEHRGIELVVMHKAGALPVRADRVHIQQLLINLVTNAMDALADTPRASKRVVLDAECVNMIQAEVAVADNGNGIPADELQRVFDPFFTTKANGTGLGLSICRAIVETYGGRIWAENQEGGGAVVRFVLPLQ